MIKTHTEFSLVESSLDKSSLDKSSLDKSPLDKSSLDKSSLDEISPNETSPNETSPNETSLDILLVDDDETFCRVLNNAIKRRGYCVTTATNIADAMTIAKDQHPVYAIVDLRIGDESGLNLVENLIKTNPEIHIVMLTGYASIATAVQAIKLGAKQYLTKPADADEIIASFNNEGGALIVEAAENPLSPKRLEWEHLQKVLLDNDGNVSATARALGMHRRTLQRKLQKRPVKK